jgi:hypothetical protein
MSKTKISMDNFELLESGTYIIPAGRVLQFIELRRSDPRFTFTIRDTPNLDELEVVLVKNESPTNVNIF